MGTPGETWDTSSNDFAGALAQVVSVNDGLILAQFPNGTIAQLDYPDESEIETGDVLLYHELRWSVVDRDLWKVPFGVGVVKKVREDHLVVEAPGGIVLTEAVGITGLEVGNTIKYTVEFGASEIIDEKPIRAREDETTYLATAFEESTKDSKLNYRNFGGYPEVLARARHIIETQFTRKSELDDIGARPVRGVLLSGPPGTGKTYLAKVLAAESDAAFFLVSGPSIVSKYVGDTEGLLRAIFLEAGSRDRALIFFDEIDSIAGERGEGSHESSNRLVAQLLTEMDGFSSTTGNVVILAATNRPDAIDPALRRPGRFDWEIKFDLPDIESRLAILDVDATRLSTKGDLPLEEIAATTDGWSGAELASIWTEAGLLAASDGRRAIDGEDLLLATDLVFSNRKASE